MSGPLAILWEDAHGLAVAKPAGMATQGPVAVAAGSATATLDQLVRAHLRPADPASAYLGTVHRLDRPVSGVVLWAKNPRAARRWAEQFADRTARKEYWALVAEPSEPTPASGVWDDLLLPPDAQGRARVASADEPRAARAVTRFEVARQAPPGFDGVLPAGSLLLRLQPETGRTHQLRAQAAARGMPIRGDVTYGSADAFPAGIALHARQLTIRHPVRREAMTFAAPWPEAWAAALVVSLTPAPPRS